MSRRQRTPEVKYLDDGSGVFRVPFDARWVTGIKALVPAYAREWDPDARIWQVDDPYVEVIVALTRCIFGSVDGDGSGGAHAAPHAAPADPFITLHLLPSAPPELIDSAYRCLARLHHLDVGGTHEQMLQLTAAHSALKARAT